MPSKARNARSASEAPPAPTGSPDRPARRLRTAAVVILVAATAAAALTKVSNYDVFWHLAAGKWMLQHKAVLRHDPFGAAGAQWVNVHWLFQVVIASLHSAGGFAMLSVLKCVLPVAGVLALAVALAKRVPPGWLILAGIAMLVVMTERIRVRPELFSLAFLAIVVVLLEGVRLGGSAKRLWWLVGIMLVWVNMHGLYFLGLGVIWSSLLGAWLDRRLGRRAAGPGEGPGLLTQRALAPILAATVACLVSPWPVQAAAHPLLLWTRVSGQSIVYTHGVSELQPTWQVLGKHWQAVVLAGLVLAALVANLRAVPIAHALWFGAFAFLALLARRNVGLIAPVYGYLLAWHGGQLLRRLASRRDRLKRLSGPLTYAAAAVGLLMAAGYATELVHRIRNYPDRFGVGLLEQNYPIGTARFLGDLEGEGQIFCENFGDAAVFIYYTSPGRRVWMDGRLEVHSLERFAEQARICNDLRTVASATHASLPAEVRFMVVQHHDTEQLSAMMESGRFRLIHIDPAAACFARTDWKGPRGPAGKRRAEQIAPNLGDFDNPLGRDGLVEGFPAERRRWYRQNPAPRLYWMGAMMLTLGRLDSTEAGSKDPLQHRCTLLAIRYLTAAGTENIVPRDVSAGMLAWAHQQRSMQLGAGPSGELPIDVNSARALHLYAGVDMSNLSEQVTEGLAARQVHALVWAGQFDAADQAMLYLLDHLPPAKRVNPPREYLNIRGTITEKLASAEAAIEVGGVDRLDPVARAKAMVQPRIGMIDRAIEQLRALGGRTGPDARRMLSDLLLRAGRPKQAREVFRDLSTPKGGDAWRVRMRLALCDWVAGELFKADEQLAEITRAHDRPAARYYHAVLLEQLGRYEQALSAVRNAASPDKKLQDPIDRIRKRLAKRAGGEG